MDSKKTVTVTEAVLKGFVLSIAAFEDPDHYCTRMSKAVADIQGTRKAPGVERIHLPGEREHLALGERRSHGISLNAAVFEKLDEVGAKYGLSLAPAA